MAGSNRYKRFYENPELREREWNEAKQAPLWWIILAVALVAAGFGFGTYGDEPYRTLGWIVGAATIAIHLVLEAQLRRRARRRLREVHEQLARP